MMKRGVFAAVLALALLVIASPAVAQISDAAGVGGTAINGVAGGVVDLYDQLGIPPAGNGAPDQNFEAGFDTYDAEGADDFIVTFPQGWVVQQVETTGTQSTGGTATSVDVTFYADDSGFPGAAPVSGCEFLGVVPTTQNLGAFVIDLPTDCNLPPGAYWVAIITNQDFAGGNGQHFWSNSTSQVNNGGVWRNPGDGFGSGCTDWDRMTTCGVGGGTNPDFLFAVRGQEGIPGFGDAGPNPLEIPTLDLFGLLALFALLGGAALILLRRRSA
ncbi:MAG: hypothetical protein AAGD01_11415 [Acidobacteriota bacterium]